MGGRLQRQRMPVMAREEDVGDHDRACRTGHCGDQMHAAAGERERVERSRRSDDSDRAGGVINGKEGEHKRARDRERHVGARRRSVSTAAAGSASTRASGRIDASARTPTPTNTITPTRSGTAASSRCEASRFTSRI